MGIFSRLFGGGGSGERDARELIRKVEESLETDGPMFTVQFMASEEFRELQKQFWPPSIVGPGGPLHDEFMALLAKVRKSGENRYMR